MKSYRDLDVYRMAMELEIEVHQLTMQLPKHELYELGSQVRRSMNSVRANIVEGYGRRTYKQEFIRFLIFSHASLLESTSHLEIIQKLYNPQNIQSIIKKSDELGIKLHHFIQYVQNHWLPLHP